MGFRRPDGSYSNGVDEPNENDPQVNWAVRQELRAKRIKQIQKGADERLLNLQHSLNDPKPGGHHGPGSYSGPQ